MLRPKRLLSHQVVGYSKVVKFYAAERIGNLLINKCALWYYETRYRWSAYWRSNSKFTSNSKLHDQKFILLINLGGLGAQKALYIWNASFCFFLTISGTFLGSSLRSCLCYTHLVVKRIDRDVTFIINIGFAQKVGNPDCSYWHSILSKSAHCLLAGFRLDYTQVMQLLLRL